jgi:hypothetical protein
VPASEPPTFPDVEVSGPVCERSSLSPQLRLAITFVVLFGLKWTLPFLGVPFTLQVLTLLVVATFFAWRFWWRCTAGRTGPLLLIGSLWAAGIVKILLH